MVWKILLIDRNRIYAMLQSFLVSFVFFLTIVSIFVNRRVIRSKYLEFLNVPYYLAPLIGAFTLFFIGGLDISQAYVGVMGMPVSEGLSFLHSSASFSTIVLFLSVAFVSLCLEVSGFFRYLAVKTLRIVGGSGKMLFFAVFWISGALALVTSNDILILTFTPFLVEFLDLADLEAAPYLVAEFFAANVFSMVFLIGNETNIIVATAHNLGFVDFLGYMFIPGLAGGLACFAGLCWIFRDSIDVKYGCDDLPEVNLNRWEFLASILLIGTLLSLAILSMFDFLLWHIGGLWAALSLALFALPDAVEKCRKSSEAEELFVYRVNQKMPWEVIPFLIGFFILVQALSVSGLTSFLTEVMSALTGESIFGTVVGVGTISTVSANLLNNIPMTVLFSDVLTGYGAGIENVAALYSLVIGSNIGANITPIGALAGIMWLKIVNHNKQRITFNRFFSIGWRITLVTALASFSALYMVLII